MEKKWTFGEHKLKAGYGHQDRVVSGWQYGYFAYRQENRGLSVEFLVTHVPSGYLVGLMPFLLESDAREYIERISAIPGIESAAAEISNRWDMCSDVVEKIKAIRSDIVDRRKDLYDAPCSSFDDDNDLNDDTDDEIDSLTYRINQMYTQCAQAKEQHDAVVKAKDEEIARLKDLVTNGVDLVEDAIAATMSDLDAGEWLDKVSRMIGVAATKEQGEIPKKQPQQPIPQTRSYGVSREQWEEGYRIGISEGRMQMFIIICCLVVFSMVFYVVVKSIAIEACK
jgi:hypothetical protein